MDPRRSTQVSRRALLATSVGLGLAAASGCTTDGAAPKGPTAPPSSVTAAPETSGILYPDGYVGPRAHQISKLVEQPVKFKIMVPQDPRVGDWSRNYFTRWLQDKTGVEIEFLQVAGGEDMMTKVNAMIAAGDVPDAFFNIGFSRTQLQLYGQQGLFQPLQDHIATQAPNLQQAMKDYPTTDKLIRSPDGNIYALPDFNDGTHARASEARAYINSDWLDKIGAKAPETTADFVEVLRAFKSADLGGGGKTIPFAAYSGAGLDRFFMNSFLYHSGALGLYVDNGRTDTSVIKDGYREGLRYLKSLLDEGLINSDAFTATPDQMLRRGNNPGKNIIGGARAYYWGLFAEIDQTDPEARWRQFRTLAPLTGPSGVRFSPWDYYTIGVETPTLIISNACQQPDLLVRWADTQYDLEVSLNSNLGQQGKRWEWAKDGLEGINGKQAIYYYPSGWNEKPADDTSGWSLFSLSYRSADFRLGEGVVEGNVTFEKPLYEETITYNQPYKQPMEAQYPPVTMSEDAAAEDAELSTNLNNDISASLAKFVTGKLDPDSDADWTGYVDRLNKIGLNRFLEIRQAGFEAFNG